MTQSDVGSRRLVFALWLCGPSIVLFAAILLRIGDGTSVLLPIIDRPLPESCGLKKYMNIDCPGCGLTRSFIHIANGNVRSALGLHPFSLILFVFVAAQLPLAIVHFVSSDLARRRWITKWNERSLIALAAGLAAFWCYRLVTGDLF